MARSHAPAALALLVAALGLAVRPAVAQEWHARYGRGLELEAQGLWGRALVEFEAASRARPQPVKRTLVENGIVVLEYDPPYHIARCLAELGHPRLALQQLKRSVAAHVTPPEKLLALRERIQTLAGKGKVPPSSPALPAVGRLTIESDPPGATIFVDGNLRGVAPVGPLTLSPGLHVVRADRAGVRAVEQHVTAVPGGEATLVIALAAGGPAGARTPPPTAKPQPPQPTLAPEEPAPTNAAATAPPIQKAPPGPPAAARTIEIPTGYRFPTAPVALAALLLMVLTGALWLRGVRRRKRPPEAGGAATRALERAATVAETDGRLGAYELQGVLGRGGMATTFRARRTSDGQTVAVKVPHDSSLADRTFVERFLREGKLGEQLHHPRIVRVLATGQETGRPYMAMELISGRTLKQELRALGPLPLRRALEIARDIAEALDYAHAKGVVHRDLKPENVMILPDGTVKVMDFGIARTGEQSGLTTTNIFLGTPLYAAPEMVDPKRADHRADLYALGIILFEVLEGTVPFTADSPYRILEMHQHAPLPPREKLTRRMPERVWAVVSRLCEKDPAARFPSAEALLVELNHLLHDFPEAEGSDVF